MDSEALYTDVFEKYTNHVNPGLAKLVSFAGFGVEMSAEGCTITDHEGRKFLDCLGGYGTFAVGHRNPRLIAALNDQLGKMGLSGKAFFCKPQADLAAKLADLAPDGLQYCFFSNSGTEAVECALKFAKASTGKTEIISTVGSYHGKSIGALSVTGREKYRKPFEPLMPGAVFVPYGDLDAATNAVTSNTAAIIVEPIQGEGGIIVPPKGYLSGLRKLCDDKGILLIADEVQTGMGRTGKLFAVEHEGVCPDLMCLAKAIGGGIMPLGVTMGTKNIWDTVYGVNPLAHTSTFGGNGLACRVGCEVLDILIEENLLEASAIRGNQMLQGFKELQADFPQLVAEVRGIGLMVGLEFAMDEVGELVVAQLLKRGLCVAYALNNPRVLRFEPPLTITEAQVNFAVLAVREAISEVSVLLAELV